MMWNKQITGLLLQKMVKESQKSLHKSNKEREEKMSVQFLPFQPPKINV